MRPLELRLRNFRSYFGDDAIFDLRHRSLVGVVGPIGSGKSSLLDAVAFALYGKTPAAGAATKTLIHQRADSGGVLLRFDVEGEIWEVARTLRRKGQSRHDLYRYRDDLPDSEPVERIAMEAEVNARIRELLGLDFDAFGRSVMLAQGRFAEFLTSGATSRDTVLKGVFGHDRIDLMREVAKRRSAAAAAELAGVAVRVERLDEIARRLEVVVETLAQSEERLEQLRKAEPQLGDLETRIALATAQRETARTHLASLARHAGRLPGVKSTAKLLDEADVVSQRRQALALELDGARTAQLDAERELGELRESGEIEILEELGDLLATHQPRRKAVAEAERRLGSATKRLDELLAREQQITAELEAAEKDRIDAANGLAAAETALKTARAAHHGAQHADMAGTLRHDLEPGDPCPVCQRKIDSLPPSPPPGALQEAATALAAAEEARSTAESGRTDAVGREARLRESLASLADSRSELVREIEQAGSAVEETRSELEESRHRLGELTDGDPVEALEQRRGRLAAMTEAATQARRFLDQVRGRHDQSIVDEQEVAKRVSALRIDVAEVAARLDLTPDIGDDDLATIRSVVDQLHDAWRSQTEASQQIAQRCDDEIVVTEQERRTLLESLGIEGDFTAALASEQARAEHLAADAARAREDLGAGEGLIAERDRLVAVKGRYDRIVHDLTDSRFVRFLLDDERGRLAELGSEHFMRLSSGRYRFTEDGKFAIVDLTAADAVRNASSLSGGETFLASLALALALAEMVTRTGGRLDAFFLDEGFGSLDPEHLDLAMEGIEALVAGEGSRLVVVVSHVSELRHRIEDLIELDRHPLTGDTRIMSA